MTDPTQANIIKMQAQALSMQQKLSGQQVVLEENRIKIVITGDQRILELTVDGVGNQLLNDTLNKAIRQSQELAVRELLNQNTSET